MEKGRDARYQCSVLEDFAVDAGVLTLLGPSPHDADRTCIAGKTCHLRQIDIVAGSYMVAESARAHSYYSVLN